MYSLQGTPLAGSVASDETTRGASFFESLRDALRLAAWRAPISSAPISGRAITAVFAAATVVAIAAQYLIAKGDVSTFNAYGLNAVLASIAINAAVITMFSQVDASSATARNLILLYFVSFVVRLCAAFLFHGLAPGYPYGGNVMAVFITAWVFGIVYVVWLAGAARQAFKVAPGVRRPLLRGVGLALALLGGQILLPHWPVFHPERFSRQSANLWEAYWAAETKAQAADAAKRRRASEMHGAHVEAEQADLLAATFAKLAPRDPAKPNVYAIGVAGWGDQDVFMRETRQSLKILGERLHFADHSVALVNNEATADELPMASMQNIAAALRAVALRMDREKDVLVLSLTSHGSREGFALQYDDLVDRTLDPQTLRALLDEVGVKNRVVIVSSCYSGAFVPALSGPNTMVLTAASAERTSFGCSDDRDWTYFGEAFFQKGLAESATLADAFVSAKATIAGWERSQGLTPSDPQISVGEDIAREFPDLVGGLASTPAQSANLTPARTVSQ